MKSTVQIKLCRDQDFLILNDLMREFCSAQRYCLNRLLEGYSEKDLRKLIPQVFKLNAGYAEDAAMTMEANINSQKELLPLYLEDTNRKIEKSEYKLSQYETGKRKPKKVDLETTLNGIRKRLKKLTEKKNALERHIENGTIPTIIYGGRENFNKRRKGEITRDEWKDLRSNRLYARGHKGKKGNLNLRIVFDENHQSFFLEVANPLALPKVREKNTPAPRIRYKLIVPDKLFDKIVDLTIPNIVNDNGIEKEVYKTYSVQIIRKKGEYTVHVMHDAKESGKELKNKEQFTGDLIAGIDMNIDRIAVSILTRQGNLKETRVFYCYELEYASSNKRNNIVGNIVKEIFKYLIRMKVKCLVIEDIKIKQQHDTNKRLNRLFDSFCYAKLTEAMTRNALKRGFQIKKINPAYTSIIGRFKYTKKYGISVHEAASFVIGRRGIGLNEKLTKDNIKTLKEEIKPRLIALLGSMEESEKNSIEGKNKRKRIGFILKKINNFKYENEWSLWSIFGKTIFLSQYKLKFKEI
jgi:IS605 OrfB family transposase